MQTKIFSKSFQLPDGREVSIETGRLARQADGAVVVKQGKTMILATAVANQEAKEGTDFFPLYVDYQEKFAAAGKIPGGFIKREGKLSDYEVLISRLVDRAIRPLFPKDFLAETQISIMLMSSDEEVLPDTLVALAASAALAVSDIPFSCPISEVRVVKYKGEYLINPSPKLLAEATLDLVVGASATELLMVEGECKEAQEDELVEAILLAHEAIKLQCQVQEELAALKGVQKRQYEHLKTDEALRKELFERYYDSFYQVVSQKIANKAERKRLISAIKDEYFASLPEDSTVDKGLAKSYFEEIHKKAARNYTLESNNRLDGRAYNEIRPIWGQIDYLPAVHGSAIFTRGETQSLTTVTLGTKLDEQLIDGAVISGVNKFMLHYNFPSFSTGEVKPSRGPGRREIGHGNLAHRALKNMIPAKNPYTIRVVSDILESNGSSSMATVCAGTMALMDAGIQIKKPVSGIAMGMISDAQTGKYAILSDILGDEDHLGDMDFKVTGTADGITACQMDIKLEGLSPDILRQALLQAKEGRLHILSKMNEVISEPKDDLKPYAPRAYTIEIPKEMIGAVIGPGGKIVQEIQAESGATIVIEEVATGGLVNIFAVNQQSMDIAVGRVKAIVAVPVVGDIYNGIVKSIQPFGAFVEFVRGKEGLLHISEISWKRLETMDNVLEVGEEISVKLIGIDPKTGKFRLSRKVLLPKPEGAENPKPRR